VGCNSNPYSGVTSRLSDKPIETKPVEDTHTFNNCPEAVDVIEGEQLQVPCTGTVTEGQPLLTFVKPAWATYDEAVGALILAPKPGDATDPNYPSEGNRRYMINLLLSSDKTPESKRTRTMTVIVHRLAQGLTVSGFLETERVVEGQPHSITIGINSPETPDGPFTVSATDLPLGLVITKNKSDPKEFTITYTPSFKTVLVGTGSGFTCGENRCLNLPFRINIQDPRGNMAAKTAAWVVVDVRQNPIVIALPDYSATLPDARFHITVQDPNGERVPLVSAKAGIGKPIVRNLVTAGPSPTANPYALVEVEWKEHPEESKAAPQTIDIKSCVNNGRGAASHCMTTPINVTFQ
jgi:hypothetical protein